jgi:3-oxoacyl-[acyl-carrier protein] reductase
MFSSLSGRVAVVTGGARGIGQATALRLSDLGATVVISSNVTDGTPLVNEIQARGGKAAFIRADVTNAPQVERLMEQAAAMGSLDILVNNAGVRHDKLILRMTDADWEQVINVNLRGTFLCTRTALKYMLRQRWGRIVNITSVIGIIGNAGQANYAAAKAGIIGLTKSTAREVATRGITVNAIAPGFIDTEMTRDLPETARQEILKRIPLGYYGTPQDVAHAVAYLVSEEARYITGQVFRVDGGLTMD